MKYTLFNTKQIYFKYLFKNSDNTSIFLTTKTIYYCALHLKLSSIFSMTQLTDIWAYELPNKPSNPANKTSVLVYNLHNLLNQQRIYLFVLFNSGVFTKPNQSLNSISELFSNANWLEREVSEMHALFFLGKKDLRNLLLPYGDATAPMLRTYPSIGLREIFYDTVNDQLIQVPTSIQF